MRTLPLELADAARSCIHCGLCLEDCPTYLELGGEADSPRGRILLMRTVAERRAELTEVVSRHLDLCLDCRACEAACPSGVRYGRLIEETRAAMHEQSDMMRRRRTLVDWLIYNVTPYPRRMRWAVRLGVMARRFGLIRLIAQFAPAIARAAAMLPQTDEALAPPALPESATPPKNPRKAVQLFAGCATTVLTPRTVENAQRVLLHNGCRVNCPRGQGCCGAIHHHGGRVEEARSLARRNVDAFGGIETIVTVAAGCGAMLRQYGALLAHEPEYAARAAALSSRVQDVSECLVALGPVTPSRPVRRRVTYHDACHHSHVMGVRAAPRSLLRLIPGLELVECTESATCCGAAGSYALTQPETAQRLARRKLGHAAATAADIIATGNVGCILHLRQVAARDGLRLSVMHTIDLLHEAYGLS